MAGERSAPVGAVALTFIGAGVILCRHMASVIRQSYLRECAGASIVALLAGCSSPFQEQATEDLRRSIVDSAERELRPARAAPEPRQVEREVAELDIPPERMEELREMAGPARNEADPILPLEENLLGDETATAALSLEQAIATSVRNNLDVQQARIVPAIDSANLVAAEAFFDWVFFADGRWRATDEPRQRPIVNNVPVGAAGNVVDETGFTMGLRKSLTSGGTLSASIGQTHLNSRTPGISLEPDPANQVFAELTLDQPLLRGFGSDVALSEVRLARNTERSSMFELKGTLIDTVTAVEEAYWDLAERQAILKIYRRLLERGYETYEVLKSRRDFDVKPSEISDAVARIEQRKGFILIAENDLRDASDRLKLLMNDPDVSVGTEVQFIPVDEAIDEPIRYSLLDSIATAIENRPLVNTALLSIDDASIRATVAENGRLPMLDLRMQARWNGLDSDAGEAYSQIGEGQFINYLVSLQFEQPLGNRAAEARYRAAQLGRLQSVVGYRDAVQQVAFDVKEALRQVVTTYKLIEQTRTSRIAATENLRTLLVQEQFIQSLTPDFLDRKLNRQEALAQAEIDEVRSITTYNKAIARLHAAMGTALERNRIKLEIPDADAMLTTPSMRR